MLRVVTKWVIAVAEERCNSLHVEPQCCSIFCWACGKNWPAPCVAVLNFSHVKTDRAQQHATAMPRRPTCTCGLNKHCKKQSSVWAPPATHPESVFGCYTEHPPFEEPTQGSLAILRTTAMSQLRYHNWSTADERAAPHHLNQSAQLEHLRPLNHYQPPP
jgi:hypothetical protein